MATINSVLIGDERTQRDITQSFVKTQIKNDRVDVVANSSLIPAFETTPVSHLTDAEEKEITDQAIKQCNGGSDESCMRNTTDRARQSKLEQKMKEAHSSATVVKGRRMTVKYTDEYGEDHTVVVPEGQTFQLDKVAGGEKKASLLSSLPELPTASETTMKILGILSVIIMSFLYAFSVVATYKTLTVDYSRTVAIAGTVAAVMFPYLGFFIMFGYFLIREVYKYQTDSLQPRIMAWAITIALGFAYFSTATLVALFTRFKDWIVGVFQPTKK